MKINYIKLNKDIKDPTKAHKHDAGFDLYAADNCTISSGSLCSISTGISFDIPAGYYGQIQERSGFSIKNTLKIKAGVIDSGYHGEIKIIFINAGEAPVKILTGDKIAQIIFHKLPLITLDKVKNFTKKTDRGTKGFGSSGDK